MAYMAAAVFAAILVLGIASFFVIRKRIRSFSRKVLGTDSLIEGFQQIETEHAITPKSVNAMTSLYLPKIRRDFPEFHYEEMKSRAENVLTSYLIAVDTMAEGRLSEGTDELHEKLTERIEQLRGALLREHFQSIKLHRTELSNYRKADGRCVITFQSAVQYFYTKEKETGERLAGSTDLLTQSRYETDVIYIQDREKVKDERDFALAANCPNCGAPLSGVGDKVCAYCGSALREVNIYAWSFSDVRELG